MFFFSFPNHFSRPSFLFFSISPKAFRLSWLASSCLVKNCLNLLHFYALIIHTLLSPRVYFCILWSHPSSACTPFNISLSKIRKTTKDLNHKYEIMFDTNVKSIAQNVWLSGCPEDSLSQYNLLCNLMFRVFPLSSCTATEKGNLSTITILLKACS